LASAPGGALGMLTPETHSRSRAQLVIAGRNWTGWHFRWPRDVVLRTVRGWRAGSGARNDRHGASSYAERGSP